MIQTRTVGEEKEEKERWGGSGRRECRAKHWEPTICRKTFKWPRNLQDPKPVIKEKQVKTETTFLTYQMGNNVPAW